VPWGWGVAAIAASLAAWGWLRHAPANATWPPSQLSIVNPGAGVPGAGRLVDITPDGEKVVFYTNTGGRGVSMLQSLDHTEPTLLPATEGGIDLHFSPDGRSVFFGTTGRAQLMRAAVDGGAAVPVRDAPSSAFIADAADGAMWISTPEFEIVRVARDGAVERRFTDATPRLTLAIMQVFADGRTALAKDYNAADGPLYSMDLVTGKLTTLLDFRIVEARVAAGLLVYVRPDGSLFAVPFDTRSMKPTGVPVQIGENVSLTGSGIAQFAVAATGTLVYVPAQPRELVLLDRAGKMTQLSDARRNFHMPRFSPDGRSVAIDFPSADGRDVWTLDREAGVLSRVTSEHDAHDPMWTRGGDLLYSSLKTGKLSVHRTRPGSGVTTQVAADARLAFTGEFLPDGKTMLTVATDFRKGSGSDIVLLDSAGRMTPVVAEPFNEGWSAPSPGGRWIAYASTLSGQSEVYVRSLSGDADQVQISSTGGSEPMWSRDGRELFYRAEVDGHDVLTVAQVQAGSTFRVLSRTKLFNVDEYDAAQPHANYDVSPDGKSFVMVHRAPTGRLTVIQNLPELVRRLSGAKAAAR
jgi:eukaryotic-like serine/threonine-protein kinase